MKISVRNMVKIYSVSNIIIDKIYNIINDDNIHFINNKIIFSSLIVMGFQMINPVFKKQKKIISIYNTFYRNKNIDKYIDFIIILFIFIFFKELKNAI